MERWEDRVTRVLPAVVSILVLLAIGIYLAVGIYVLLGGNPDLKTTLLNNVAGNIGVPAAALASFVIVAVLWKLFPPKAEGQLSVKWLSLEFTGPAGPITLWVVCFLAFVYAIHLLRLPR